MPPAKICEHCKKPFLAYRKSLRYCGNTCSVRANPKPQNQIKYPITLELLQEADAKTAIGKSRARYVADRVGSTPAAVLHAAKRLKFKWTKKPRQKFFLRTTHVERRYVYSVGCCICGENRVVDAAHLVPAVEGGSGMEDNIVPLCPTHHRLYDRGKLSEEENEKLVDFLYVKYPDIKAKFPEWEIERGEFRPQAAIAATPFCSPDSERDEPTSSPLDIPIHEAC